MIRKLFHAISYIFIYVMKPFKIFAYRTRFSFIRGLILEMTSRIDWMMIFLNIQNNIMLMNWKAYRGLSSARPSC